MARFIDSTGNYYWSNRQSDRPDFWVSVKDKCLHGYTGMASNDDKELYSPGDRSRPSSNSESKPVQQDEKAWFT